MYSGWEIMAAFAYAEPNMTPHFRYMFLREWGRLNLPVTLVYSAKPEWFDFSEE